MGDLGVSLTRFLICSSDLPMRASLSLANFAFARLCWGVCACTKPIVSKPSSWIFDECRVSGGLYRVLGCSGSAYHCGFYVCGVGVKMGRGERRAVMSECDLSLLQSISSSYVLQ